MNKDHLAVTNWQIRQIEESDMDEYTKDRVLRTLYQIKREIKERG